MVISEKAGRANIPVNLTTPSGEATIEEVRVKYSTSSGSARSGSDFKAKSGVLVFPPQSVSGTTLHIDVEILDDARSEPEKSFSVVLSEAVGAEIVTPTRAIVITDDDPVPGASSGEPQ